MAELQLLFVPSSWGGLPVSQGFPTPEGVVEGRDPPEAGRVGGVSCGLRTLALRALLRGLPGLSGCEGLERCLGPRASVSLKCDSRSRDVKSRDSVVGPWGHREGPGLDRRLPPLLGPAGLS